MHFTLYMNWKENLNLHKIKTDQHITEYSFHVCVNHKLRMTLFMPYLNLQDMHRTLKHNARLLVETVHVLSVLTDEQDADHYYKIHPQFKTQCRVKRFKQSQAFYRDTVKGGAACLSPDVNSSKNYVSTLACYYTVHLTRKFAMLLSEWSGTLIDHRLYVRSA